MKKYFIHYIFFWGGGLHLRRFLRLRHFVKFLFFLEFRPPPICYVILVQGIQIQINKLMHGIQLDEAFAVLEAYFVGGMLLTNIVWLTPIIDHSPTVLKRI